MIYLIWDYWTDGVKYYCIVYKGNELYFSEADIPEELRGIEENG